MIYALVIATVAFAGIEAASDLAPELEFEPGDVKRVLAAGAVAVPVIYAAMAAVALMAVPVVATPQGPETELAGRYIDDPVLEVVQSYEPAWLADVMQWMVVVIAPTVLWWAASTAMLTSRAMSTRSRPTGRSRAGSESSDAGTRRRTWRSQ